MHVHSATNSGHIRTYVCMHTPGAFWSVDIDIYFNES